MPSQKFEWSEGHAPVKEATISITADDWNRLTNLIYAETKIESVKNALVEKGELISAKKYNLLADALKINNVSNNHTLDSSLITAAVIDALRIAYNNL
jgi:hypothetical protein